MKFRILLLLFLLLPFPVLRYTAQQSFDPKHDNLAAYAHFKSLTQSEVEEILAKAQSGDAEAQFWVGIMYGEGRLVARDFDKANQWFLKSAKQGYAPAQRMYGPSIRERDSSVAERWLLRAAEQGDADAQYWLGVGYEQNWFGTTDVKEAVKWYQKAADNGNPDAQVELGDKYEHGEGVEQNYRLAAEWYRKAAEHVPDLGGAGQGRNRLGLLYMQGLGVPQDYAQAYFWFSLNGPAGNTTDAKAHLSSAQIQDTDRLVKEWRDEHRVAPEVAAAFHIEN